MNEIENSTNKTTEYWIEKFNDICERNEIVDEYKEYLIMSAVTNRNCPFEAIKTLYDIRYKKDTSMWCQVIMARRSIDEQDLRWIIANCEFSTTLEQYAILKLAGGADLIKLMKANKLSNDMNMNTFILPYLKLKPDIEYLKANFSDLPVNSYAVILRSMPYDDKLYEMMCKKHESFKAVNKTLHIAPMPCVPFTEIHNDEDLADYIKYDIPQKIYFRVRHELDTSKDPPPSTSGYIKKHYPRLYEEIRLQSETFGKLF